MDSSPSSQSQHNWLAFSLSNASASSSLFQAFHTNTGTNIVADRAAAATATPKDAEDVASTGATATATATDLSIFPCPGPKLEDFLGGSTSSTAATAAVASVAVSGTPQMLNQYSAENAIPEHEIYDSELKRIAASFLRGFSSDSGQKQLTAALSDPPPKKAVDTFGQRTSIYRGVTRHRWTGRYEAHLWDNSCRREGQSRKGRQVYLGGYDKEDKAARAYDLAALKYWGPTTTTNFPITNYEKELGEMKNMTRQEFVASLRRRSSGFSRGASIYRGVTRHHQHGRWQARIGRVAGNKDLYLGTFSTQEEAAEAYDIAAIKFRGLNAVTNFDMSRYDVKSIARSNLPVGGFSATTTTNKPKTTSDSTSDAAGDRDLSSSLVPFQLPQTTTAATTTALGFSLPIKPDTSADCWAILGSLQNPNTPPLNVAVSSADQGQSQSTQKPTATFGMEAGNSHFGDHQQQQSSGYSSVSAGTLSYAASPIGLNIGGGGGDGVGYGNWVTTPFHLPLQAGKPASVSVFQTPIFGME